jgi:hypothetical protein
MALGPSIERGADADGGVEAVAYTFSAKKVIDHGTDKTRNEDDSNTQQNHSSRHAGSIARCGVDYPEPEYS